VLTSTTRGLPVRAVVATFERFESSRRFDLVYAAAAWHWIDPATRWARAVDLLASGGELALFGSPAELSGLRRKFVGGRLAAGGIAPPLAVLPVRGRLGARFNDAMRVSFVAITVTAAIVLCGCAPPRSVNRSSQASPEAVVTATPIRGRDLTGLRLLPPSAAPPSGTISVPWSLAGQGPDGRSLLLRVTFGGCNRPSAVQVDETAAAVRVRVYTDRLPQGQPCTANLAVGQLTVHLQEPLSHRSLESR